MTTFGFIILRHARNEIDNLLGKRCFESIRKHYPTNTIVIIDDHSLLHDVSYIDEHTTVEYSELHPGVGELLPWYYFYKKKYFDVACILHDSMGISENIDIIQNKNKFLWQFEGDHMLGNHGEFEIVKYLRGGNMNWYGMVSESKKWKGCFGVCGIFEWDVLVHLQIIFGIFDEHFVSKIRTRTDRMALERIFGWCCYILGYNTSILNDIHYYPNAFYETRNEVALEKMNHDILNKIYPIIKIWRGR